MAIEPSDLTEDDELESAEIYRKQIWNQPSYPTPQPTIAIRLIGAAMVPAGIGALYLGSWLFAWLGWSSRIAFVFGGVFIGGGIACLIVPASAMAILDKDSVGGGSFVGRWISRLCIGAGAIFGIGVWLKH